jgi:hypothetical protein
MLYCTHYALQVYDAHLAVRRLLRLFYAQYNPPNCSEEYIDEVLRGHISLHGKRVADYAPKLMAKLQDR